MSLSDPARRASLAERIQGILLRPSSEWDKIDVEPATTQSLFTGYAMILAAIGPVCSAIGMVVFGFGIPGIATYHASPIGAAVSAVVSYVLALAGVFVVGLIIDALAPNFGGQKNQVQAMKVAVYGSTASWLAGVFGILPALSMLAIVGIYSLYLYYVGLPKLMKTTPDKAMGYTALVVLCAIVVFIVIGLVTAPLRMLGGAAAMGTGGVTVVGNNGAAVVNGDGSTVKIGGALGALAAAGQQMEAQTKSVTTTAGDGSTTTTTTVSGAPAVSTDALKALLPLSVAGYTRGEITAESGGAGMVNMANAKAEYVKGDARMTVAVSDTGAMGALGGIVGAMGVNSNKETSTGYEKVSSVGGRMINEEYDRSARSGKYSVMQGRAMVAAEGSNGATMDDLKAAVAAVDPGRVAQIAHS